jgi:hypothetical protein
MKGSKSEKMGSSSRIEKIFLLPYKCFGKILKWGEGLNRMVTRMWVFLALLFISLDRLVNYWRCINYSGVF